MSFPLTMGFAPEVVTANPWQTREGRRTFLINVTQRVRAMARDAPAEMEYTREMEDALSSASGMADAFGSTLSSPPPSVKQAIEYVALAIVERVRMARRLETLRARKCVAVQPYGCTDVVRHEDEFGPETAGVPGQYASFLQQQRALRTRFT